MKMGKSIPTVHKQGKEKAVKYVGFGVYEDVLAPLCVGAKALYEGKSYYTHKNWKYVTCKHCLKKKERGNGQT